MPLVSLLSIALLASPAPAEPRGLQSPAQERTTRIPWFSGTFDELLTEAASSQRVVFLDFYSLTNAFSNKLEKDTLNRPEVVAELASMLCYRIDVDAKDADAKESRAAKKRY